MGQHSYTQFFDLNLNKKTTNLIYKLAILFCLFSNADKSDKLEVEDH
ncbi:MAG: hypothetical protein UT32_C0014G0016 [Parcubacteria group bacterium GW2011_GWC2_39_14]|nr:MAG: hypothetical protein UT32_C0014G0016 [Parcubacteria group bacterium GW2011_GWC2_39_14]KKR54464.1 MAG: hypothetical protein UT91_C0015G0016 [Parcubacteria group bacterium GW2011_GWA2_40_23]